MSEKVRSLNLATSTGNVLAAVNTNTTTANISGSTSGVGLIGAPTLISSTFSAATTQSLTPTTGGNSSASLGGGGGGGVGGNSPTPLSYSSLVQHHHQQQQHSGGSDTESSSEFATGVIMAQLNFHLLQDINVGAIGGGGSGGMSESNSIMNSSQISATSNDSIALSSASPATLASGATAGGGGCGVGVALKGSSNGKHVTAQSVAGKLSCRFPKLEECAHFHYERVQLGPLAVRLVDDKSELLTSSIASQSIGGDIANPNQGSNSVGAGGPPSFRSFSPSNCWFIIKVMPHRTEPFLVRRSFDNMQMLDEMLHRCVYDRKISGLRNLNELDFKSEDDVEYAVAKYLERFSKIASDSLTCGTILTWFQLDNKGRRLPLADGDTMRSINTPAVGAAYGVRRYTAQASDEISIEVGDMISVIDMPSPAESIWWRGKKSHLQKSHYEVGFFPQSCVATIGDKVPRHFPLPAPLVGQLDVSPTKPVLRKHGKLIAFFRSFILSRPSRRRLKQSGIYRERVFSCDLSEHLLNSGQEIPMVLKCCAEFLEDYGIVDGIYRLSGITSNIQRLRRAFDEERIPDLGNPEMKQDIHAVSSLLKMYFRELPNPLCTYQLYDNFVEAIQEKAESSERLRLMKETVLKLPPPHYRTLKYLANHLNKISQHSARTGMTDKNLAIVWAPNLLRSPALESGGVAALRGVGVQAVVTEYLIRNCHLIFDALDDSNTRLSYIATAGAAPTPGELRMDSLTDCESLLVEQREHDQSLVCVERPKSLSASGPKLISLEEAQERHSRVDSCDVNKSMPINMASNNAANIGSYIEVGGGPSSLPDKYHTVLPVPRSWQKRKTHSWKSLFTRNQRSSNGAGSGNNPDLKSALASTNSDAMPHHKESAQVTFADADSIINCAGIKIIGKSSLLKHQDKTKSEIELFEGGRSCGDSGKPMEICVRSSSIDSLRTAGHSRSVSHDSYFDLLQSPQRGHMTTCPSRELSELGLNFDREEPEMRIFSESESLVSSPRVGKENIPPPSSSSTSRRILRARPEEFSSQTNSVNPSPKKQPRLNLLLSPTSGAHNAQNWTQSMAASAPSGECHEHTHLSGDESCCKRYKLEDQLSDIQYIDCSTPEHTVAAAPQTLYTSVQIHNPPKSSLSKSSLYSSSTEGVVGSGKMSDNENVKATTQGSNNVKNGKFHSTFGKSTVESTNAALLATRYSYPTVQLGAKRKEQESNATTKDRFSYPGSNRVLPKENKIQNADVEFKTKSSKTKGGSGGVSDNMEYAQTARTVSFSQKQSQLPQQALHHLPKPVPELLRPKNRYSYCDTSSDTHSQHRHSAITQQQLNMLLRSTNTSEQPKENKNEMERSKLSEVTPSSPLQSPRYSLLVGGDTSSENSSAVNTPQYDCEPLMMSSAISGMSAYSGHSMSSTNQQQQHLLAADNNSYMGLDSSRESLGGLSNLSHNICAERRDMHALKRELSLDLKSGSNNCSKMTVDHADGAATLPARMQLQQQLIPSPNNSNFTDNTSQSVTPSEFGYQHLQRHSSMHSLLAGTEDNSPNYEDYENTPSNLGSPLLPDGKPMGGGTGNGGGCSPIKSTISITYNLKSPKSEERKKQKPLLETSFDEHTVYEQVKLFRNSVTEVNQLLNHDNNRVSVTSTERKSGLRELENLKEEEELKRLDIIPLEKEVNRNDLITLSDEEVVEEVEEESNSVEDVDMLQQPQDSLDDDDDDDDESSPLTNKGNNRLLYENVELRKPKSIYENICGEEMKASNVQDFIEEKVELDSLDSIKTIESSKSENLETLPLIEGAIVVARRSPSNFSVKELATKFETSPVEQLPAFDFSIRSSVKKHGMENNSSVEPKSPNEKNTPVAAASNTTSSATSPNNVTPPSTNIKQKLNKTQQITRSLDENAFVREFGSKHLLDLATKSSHQLPEFANSAIGGANDIANRRKSFDFTRPKTLNQPKRLPGMSISEEVCLKSEKSALPLKLELSPKEQNFNNSILEDHDFETSELKITPTTENRISLIQHNVAANLPPQAPSHHTDLSNSNSNLGSLNSLKVLSGVKLDRERIDKIKEERRQQLTQKYRAESFKSRSKTDLNTAHKDEDAKFHAESMRVKSKSRGDMRTLQKDIDNLKEFGRSVVGGGSETTLHQQHNYIMNTSKPAQPHRVRSISDEKNQNCDVSNTGGGGSGSGVVIATRTINSNSNSRSNSDSSSASDDNSKQRSTVASSINRDQKQEEYSARATVQKFERKSLDYSNGAGSGSVRERRNEAALNIGGNGSSLSSATNAASRSSISSNREKISPQFSIRDVTAMFESRSQNQQ